MKATKLVETSHTVTVTLTGNDIYAYVYERLKAAGHAPKEKVVSVSVHVDVPTGGDYSGMALDLDEHPVTVTLRTYTPPASIEAPI